MGLSLHLLQQISVGDVSGAQIEGLGTGWCVLAGMRWIQLVVDFGAVVGLSTTLLIGLYSQARIYLAIGRDGLLPAAFGEISDRSGAPVAAQLLCGALALGMAAVLDVHHLASILSIGGPWASPAWLASSRLLAPRVATPRMFFRPPPTGRYPRRLQRRLRRCAHCGQRPFVGRARGGHAQRGVASGAVWNLDGWCANG